MTTILSIIAAYIALIKFVERNDKPQPSWVFDCDQNEAKRKHQEYLDHKLIEQRIEVNKWT